MQKRMKLWETSVLLALSLSLLTAAWAEGRQQRLSGKLVRLHVLANSDSDRDQNIKLRVRDAVLVMADEALAGAADAQEAQRRLSILLPALTREAERVSGQSASVTLSRERYPLRRYENFALPAGEYCSLRVLLGEARGRNWWCVVYPPLCLQSAEDTGSSECFSDNDLSLISAEDGEYALRFRILELWGELREKF